MPAASSSKAADGLTGKAQARRWAERRMDDEIISVIDAAAQLGTRKQQLFKIIKRLGLSTIKQRNSGHKNQVISYITKDDFDLIGNHMAAGQEESEQRGAASTFQVDRGVFYLIQLEPDHDPGRFKVGFASNLPERLRDHRCSAPFATVVATWPCLLLWEKTAIDCITQSCEKLHTEVFRTDDISRVKETAEKFFALLPDVE